MPRLQIPNKLKPFLTKSKRFKVAIGGRGSGKSMGFADIFLMKAQTEAAKVLCGREFQNSIEDSVYGLMVSELSRIEASGFTIQANKIDTDNGGGVRYRGMARNTESVKSLHGFKYFWGEEAQTFSSESIKLLTPSIREADSEIWFSANPRASADPFSQRFIVPFQESLMRDGYYEDDQHLIVMMNWRDNPWFPKELEDERKWDYENLPRAQYDHIWEGAFNDSVEKSIIQPEWFDAAIDAHIKLGFDPIGARVAAHDPSDLGPDDKGYAMRHGNVVLRVESMSSGTINEGAHWAAKEALEDNVDQFGWDGDGMGIAIRNDFASHFAGKKIDTFIFRGSEEPNNPDDIYEPINQAKIDSRTNKETFRNRRAQGYWGLRDRFYRTYLAVAQGRYQDPEKLISISSSIGCIASLRSQLCRIPMKDGDRIQILNKQEMAKKPYQLPSPNESDAVMMLWGNPSIGEALDFKINFSGWGG